MDAPPPHPPPHPLPHTPPHTVVIVSHTHWDREWYHPLGRMRQRLARLIDALLDEPDGLPFLLDGQSIVLDDYAMIRPGRAPGLREALRDGRLEAGPWYVLADMLLPGGEALVRNLLEGTQTVREAGGTPPDVLYSPDAFGHSGAGPVLAEGFGLRVAIVWRGLGGPMHPQSTVVQWTHPSGAKVLLYHLPPGGYEVGSSMPVAPEAAALRWQSIRHAVLGENPLRIALLPNGADHHARQPERAATAEALRTAAVPHAVVCDSLRGFAARLMHAASGVTIPEISGELRDSTGWSWSLQGTFATRAHQKRTNAQLERLLVRDAEPWAALAWFVGAYDEPALRTAWKTLLATHPHDTLCGCSVDDVAVAADQRWADARVQASGIRDDALCALMQLDPAAQSDQEAHWHPMLIIRNPAARARGGAVRLRLIDASVADPVGPGSVDHAPARVAPSPAPPAWTGDEQLQLLRRSRQFDRVESPRHYPRNAVVRVSDMMAWVGPVAGYGVQPVWLAELASIAQPVPPSEKVRATATELCGPAWNIASSVQGLLATHTATGARVNPVGWLESVTDAGDTYTPSLRGEPVFGHWSAPRLHTRGPLRAGWEMSTELERPRNSVAGAVEASRELPRRNVVSVTASATVALTAGTDWIEVTMRGDNPAGDHRLRWVLPLPAGIHANRVIADAAFGAAYRVLSDRAPSEWSAEERLPTAPLHRWLCFTGDAFAFGIVSDGLAEYELMPNGHLAITLLRAVGELSRRDVMERPGHAGWPAATPLAQSRGPFVARFAIVVLPEDRDAALMRLATVADDVLLPLTGDTWRGVATPLPAFPGLTLEGDGLTFSTAKRSEDGNWLVLRCVNQLGTAVRGVWHLPRDAREVRHSRLDETPGLALTGAGPRIRFEAPPNGITTMLVR